MVRTKADAARKAGGKASRKTPVLSGRSTSKVSKSGTKGRSSGGNSYCRRPTPSWQVPINQIFKKTGDSSTSAEESQQTDDVINSSVNEPGTSGTSNSHQETTTDIQPGDNSDMSSGSEREEMEGDEEIDESGEEIDEDESVDEELSTNGDEKPLNGNGNNESNDCKKPSEETEGTEVPIEDSKEPAECTKEVINGDTKKADSESNSS